MRLGGVTTCAKCSVIETWGEGSLWHMPFVLVWPLELCRPACEQVSVGVEWGFPGLRRVALPTCVFSTLV